MRKAQLVGGVFLSLLLLTAAATAQDHAGHQEAQGMQMPMMDMAGGSLAQLQGEEFDVGFMSMMIAHHRAAVDMAAWIVERTDNPEIRTAAEAVMDGQEPEIQQMTAWLRDWYGREVDSMMASMMQDEMAAMQEKMAAGEDADSAFLEMMSEHHMGAIDMAQLALVQTEQQELRALARDIIVAQAGEIYQYQQWLTESR